MFSGPAQGLYSSPNPFSQTPPGTLKTADDVRFTAPGVIEPRRGYDVLTTGFGTSDSLADSFAFYASTILLAYDLTKVSLYTSSWSDFSGTFAPVGSNRMRFEGAARSVFFNTALGLFDWDGVGISGQPFLAGNPLPFAPEVTPGSLVNGWMPPDTAVAYRVTICSKDAFGRIIEGPPSGRATLRNILTVAVSYLVHNGGGSTTVVATTNAAQTPHYLIVGDVVTLAPGEPSGTGGSNLGFAAGPYTITAVPTDSSFEYNDGQVTAFSYYNTIVQNFEVTRNADLTIPLPIDVYGQPVNTNNFIRVYRSEATAHATDTPSDELFQCYESGYLTATDISNGYIVVTDTAPESTIDVPLYTNENTGFGALQANYRPPVALDIAYWAGRMWFANVAQKFNATLSLIGVGSPDGLQDGDTIHLRPEGGTIADDITITAKTSPGASDEFQIFSDGDPGWNIERTAQAMCACINALPVYNPPTVPSEAPYAYYASSDGGIPGTMLLVSRNFGLQPSGESFGFSVYSARGTAFTPNLPDPTTPLWPALVAVNDAHPARLYYSRLGQPEAVPLDNYEPVNSDNDAILRIFPLHYRLLVFKTDGIYTCSNVEPFTITKISAYKLLAPDSVHVLEDRVYALTDQGLIAVSDSGVVQISNCIDDIFNAMMSPGDISTLAARTFGLGYRSERQSLLWCPKSNPDLTVTPDNEQAFVYSTLADGFTRYSFGARCAAINPDDNSLVFAPDGGGVSGGNVLMVENKALNDTDYYDVSTVVGHPAAVSGAAVTFGNYIHLMHVGDVLASNAFDYYPIVSISGHVATLSGVPGWTTGSTLTLFPAIHTAVEFNKIAAGTPAELKLVGQVSLAFRANGIHDVTATFSSEIASSPEDVTLSAVGWGEFPWGGVPYGNPTKQLVRVEPIPQNVAQCAQLSVGFTTRQAMTKYDFLGIDVQEAEDAKVNR